MLKQAIYVEEITGGCSSINYKYEKWRKPCSVQYSIINKRKKKVDKGL